MSATPERVRHWEGVFLNSKRPHCVTNAPTDHCRKTYISERSSARLLRRMNQLVIVKHVGCFNRKRDWCNWTLLNIITKLFVRNWVIGFYCLPLIDTTPASSVMHYEHVCYASFDLIKCTTSPPPLTSQTHTLTHTRTNTPSWYTHVKFQKCQSSIFMYTSIGRSLKIRLLYVKLRKSSFYM